MSAADPREELRRERERAAALEARLHEVEERLAALNRIGIALSAERDVDALLEKILTESRAFSDSEAGSLYLREDGPEGRRLRFKLAQNDAVAVSFAERTVAVDESSLAGFVAVRGEPLVLSLATQAAVSLKANRLTASIRRLFEDFAKAAIVAVEQRDPTTAGHSNRVADFTETLARLVDHAGDGPYASVSYSKEDLHEIKTAALLHDFGKIAIPERVLVKAKKLSDDELLRIRDRFDFALEAAEADEYRSLLEELARTGGRLTPEALVALEQGARVRAAELEELFEEVRRANEPTVLPDDRAERLRGLLSRTWYDRRGRGAPLLQPEEFRFLAIRQGSLSPEERTTIETHVSQTWRFLSSIPWTADLTRVPNIAYGHHEKLDGTGYPQKLGETEIPVATRALTVCDVYDALTASDRPYKKAVPRDAALSILEGEARQGKLDRWLVETFIGGKVWGPPAGS